MTTLFVVSTPIGNLSDITERARDVLGEVGTVYAEDTRRTRILMAHLDVRVDLRSLHAHNEAARIEEVLDRLDRGESVALVSDAGTPLVSDPGSRLVGAVTDRGHSVIPIPGPSSVLAALVGSGLPGDRFCFLGFPPRKGDERGRLLERVADAPETVILFESPERLSRLLDDLGSVCSPDRKVVVARELTKVHEEFWRGTIGGAMRYYEEHPPRGEIVVLVEAAAESRVPDAVDEAAAGALAVVLLDEGMRPSGASREVSRRMGIPRNLAYRIVHDAEAARARGEES